MPARPDRPLSRQSAIIIGGGIAGLATGCYLQRCGYQTLVLEKNAIPGGVSVSWQRKGYTFDGATNWLPGSAPSLNFHEVLREVVDFDQLQFIDPEDFVRIERADQVLTVYNDVDRLRQEMLRLAPEDAAVIEQFTGAVAQVARLPLMIEKPRELIGLFDLLPRLPTNLSLLFFVRRWRKLTIGQYAQRFSSPHLREMFKLIFPRHEHFSVMGLIFSLGWMNLRSAGYPMGGSARFAQVVERRYLELGGEIRYRTPVARIIVEQDAARGVQLQDGSQLAGDLVIAAMDAQHTVRQLLQDRYRSPQLEQCFAEAPVFPALVQVSLGIARQLEGEAHKSVLCFPRPLSLGSDQEIPCMVARICHFDPSFAPPGKTAVVVHIRTHDHQHWADLRRDDRPRYQQEKDRAARAVIQLLERRYGGIAENLEVCDVATPATWMRYTHLYKASYQGWAPVPEMIGRSLKKTLPGLRDFYLVGQWLEPAGGLPRVIFSGRHLAQLICREDGRQFVAS